MDVDFYQEQARMTAIYPNVGKNLYYPTLGLCGEAGEVAEKIKKVMRDDNGLMSLSVRHSLIKELGDVMWYVGAIASELGLDLSHIMQENLIKLQSRSERDVLTGSGDDR